MVVVGMSLAAEAGGATALDVTSALALAAALPLPDPKLDDLPWIGDGRPVAEGADWYAPRPAAQFQTSYVLPPGVTNAIVHIACAGYYDLDGSDVNDCALMPLWSPYDKTIYADTWTLSALPHPATNRLSLTIGNGFYNLPPLRFWGSVCFRDHVAHGAPCFKLRIEGVEELVWTWKPTALVQNAPYLGTIMDESAVGNELRRAVAVQGPCGRIVPRRAPQIVAYDWLGGKARWLEEGRRQVIDFGRNATGMLSFSCAALKPEDRIEIVYGERLNADGSVNVLTQTAGQIKKGNGGPGAPRVAAQRDVSVSRPAGCADYVGFPFTWHCFRYAEVRGCPQLIKNAVMTLVSSDLTETELGKNFTSSHPKLNQLHAVCRNTFRSNLVGVQSDCPGREKLGYGGDIVATCEAMILNYDMKEFYLKTLQDFADEAEDDGWITETAPFVGIADASGLASREKTRRGPISWALVVPELMNSLLNHYPEAADRILAYYPVCARYVRLMDAAHPSGYVPKCIGDHEALERAPNDVTATAHWHRFVSLTAKYAERLGKTEDAVQFKAIERKVRNVFAERFVKDGVVANGTQSAQAIALYLGLVPAEQVPAAEARLLAAIAEKGDAVSTGIFSTRYMLMYLSEHGKRDVAERIVLHEGFPGWLHMLERGATSLWETWKESDDVYSNCHPMFGSVDEWLLRFGK